MTEQDFDCLIENMEMATTLLSNCINDLDNNRRNNGIYTLGYLHMLLDQTQGAIRTLKEKEKLNKVE